MKDVFLGRGKGARQLELGRQLGEGAAGTVHLVEGMPGSAAKLYHGEAEARRHEAKIEAMIAAPPDLPPAEHKGVDYPQIAWPEAKLFDRGGRFIGFLMPVIDFGRSTSLVNLLQKSSRRIEKLSDYYGYRVLVARNLASVFAELHRAGHHMIDMKPANLRFYPTVSWMAVVDTDGFSIQGKHGRIPADVLSDEYIAPESWKKKPAELAEQQDLFALAVIIFQLLNNGVHPFSGAAGGTSQATDLQARILEGLYPYAMRPRPGVAPSAASIHRMFRRGTRAMFDNAFLPGSRRPTAEEWRDHIDGLMDQLTPCAAKPSEHVHFGAGCGFCGHEARVAAAKARPSTAATARIAPRTKARRHPVPPGRLALGSARPIPSPSQVRRPPLRHVQHPPMRGPQRRKGGWGGFLAAAALIAMGVGTQSYWRPLLPGIGGAAQAADAQNVPPLETEAPAARLAAFEEPRDYLVLPTGGALTVPLRQGPGDSYPLIERLTLHDSVIGKGTSRDSGGGEWVWVTRSSDGAAGYVHQAALLQRTQPGETSAPAPVAVDEAELAAGKRVIDARYQQLLGGAEGYDRTYLIDGQKLWEAQRRRCGESPHPDQCRAQLDAQRLADLNDWRAAELSGSKERPGLIPASASTLP